MRESLRSALATVAEFVPKLVLILGVSANTLGRHCLAYAGDYGLQDGSGLAYTIRKHLRLAVWLPFRAGFLLYNYCVMARGLARAPNG